MVLLIIFVQLVVLHVLLVQDLKILSARVALLHQQSIAIFQLKVYVYKSVHPDFYHATQISANLSAFPARYHAQPVQSLLQIV